MSDEAPSAPPPVRTRRRFFLGTTVFALLPVAAALSGGYLYVTGGRVVTTENAYVKADLVAVSTDVSGRVVEIAAAENDLVEPGQLLFRLDEEPFRITLKHTEAQRAGARHQVDALRAIYRQKRAELTAADDDSDYYATAFERGRKLSAKGVISQSTLDEKQLKLRAARQRVAALRQEIAKVVADLGGDPDLPAEQHPSVLAATAARDQAALDLRRSTIRAPTAAVVTRMGLQVGEYVEAGTPVFSLVSTKAVWVEANLKETDLTRLRVGHPATVRVDAYPDRIWKAQVASISPATGSEFALLPAQNASGNWVKVVQRLPVRLTLTAGPTDLSLRAGMSVVVDIDTGYERPLPSIVASALAWVLEGR